MQRVLSFQMARGIGESSEYVTKRLCFSFLFSVGFVCLLCGFLLGRFAAERSMEARTLKMRLKIAENGLRNTEYLQHLVLRELERASFDHGRTASWETPHLMEANLRRVDEFFSNLSIIHETTSYTSYVHAIVRGASEPDRYVMLSANGDGIAVAFELAQVLDSIYSLHEWRPRRSLIFCVSLLSSDVCTHALPGSTRRKVMTYVAVHGHFARANGHVTLSGSDIMRSVAVEAIKIIPGDSNWTYLEHEIFGPRLSLNIPQLTFSLNESNLAHSQTHRNRSSRLGNVILAQTISQTIWRLSEGIAILWEPKYLNETVNRVLESINTGNSRDAKEKLRRTLRALLTAVNDLNVRADGVEGSKTLCVRIWNDLLLDLDRALLCADENSRSRTDLTILRELSHESNEDALTYLDEMAKCYEDAIQVLDAIQTQER